MAIRVILAFCILLAGESAWAAVGCTLNDPDRDIRRLFPTATNYRTQFISIKDRGGEKLYAEIQQKLGDELDSKYEAIDVPYAYYTVLEGKNAIGYVHGVNQKGRYGGMQLILATDMQGRVVDFYYQKLTSPESKSFRDTDFTGCFKGLTLLDFYREDLRSIIKDPSQNSRQDYLATIRGLKKNMILFDIFLLDRRFDTQYLEWLQMQKEKDGETKAN